MPLPFDSQPGCLPMIPLPTRKLVALACAALLATAAHAAGKPLIGISLSIETDGFFSTTLKKVTITAVKAGAPAEKAGLQVGDEVVAANDIPIAGTPGSKLSGLMENAKPGDHLKLRVHRGSDEQVVDIVVGER
jgi:C-terminal processing protease CtpA/Prc